MNPPEKDRPLFKTLQSFLEGDEGDYQESLISVTVHSSKLLVN